MNTFELTTTTRVMERIAHERSPWAAYRDFLESWTYDPEHRAALIAQPPHGSGRLRRWSVLLAATVEALAAQDGVPVPGWTSRPEYGPLERAWCVYYRPGKALRDWCEQNSPSEFARRRIWSGSRLLRSRA
jgi:hypothetical protein